MQRARNVDVTLIPDRSIANDRTAIVHLTARGPDSEIRNRQIWIHDADRRQRIGELIVILVQFNHVTEGSVNGYMHRMFPLCRNPGNRRLGNIDSLVGR